MTSLKTSKQTLFYSALRRAAKEFWSNLEKELTPSFSFFSVHSSQLPRKNWSLGCFVQKHGFLWHRSTQLKAVSPHIPWQSLSSGLRRSRYRSFPRHGLAGRQGTLFWIHQPFLWGPSRSDLTAQLLQAHHIRHLLIVFLLVSRWLHNVTAKRRKTLRDYKRLGN